MAAFVEIARDFSDGSSETWSRAAAPFFNSYLLDMLRGTPSRDLKAVALKGRMRNGQLVVLRARTAA